MVCQTVRQGFECFFMNKKGCQFNGGSCHPIVEQCNGCQRAMEFPTGTYCLSFPDPAIKWQAGNCNLATHLKKAGNGTSRGKLNPLKASKRRAH
ncbi:MAG: PxxKW family cysteine-rich protein [Deltaproteobacteria bacterium]|nr:PxxKW family cysteine-rich protein [Deltaproteobacteria bacterium]MBW2299104.1 PxxKW family cysteine-rich protein [Deltaproteobacteria bacterium]